MSEAQAAPDAKQLDQEEPESDVEDSERAGSKSTSSSGVSAEEPQDDWQHSASTEEPRDEAADEADEADRKFQQDLQLEQQYQFSRIVSATRLHMPQDAEEIPPSTAEHLQRYVSQAKQLGVIAAIAVNGHVEEVRRICEETEPDFQVHILHVPCWGNFVPALNALLNFAQRSGAKYILFQSLEVCCTPSVLQRILDHHDPDSLVVGPVFEGHNFWPGEQVLDGRSSPWNTLALWSVRKLALTGFLCIADGLPDSQVAGRDHLRPRRIENPQESEAAIGAPMGSDSWWDGEQFERQESSVPTAIPAGVEEVTAIALLQHLHGFEHSRAVLLQLPAHLEAQLSWTAKWEKDEARQKWHKYKMASKVARPAAQLQELFKFHKTTSSSSLPDSDADGAEPGGGLGLFRRRPSKTKTAASVKSTGQEATGATSMKVGKVMHYGESIRPPFQIQWICLTLCCIFYANCTAVLSTAFGILNAKGQDQTWHEVLFVAALLGGVYLPIPASLWLTRIVTRQAGHFFGLLLFLAFLFMGHTVVVLSHVLMPAARWPLVLARLVQGMGSGVLFQTRHILAIMSTSDHHVELQSLNFLMGDLGLGFGALFPAVVHYTFGSGNQNSQTGELIPSIVFMLVIFGLGTWVLLRFPRQLSALPYSVRFPDYREKKNHRLQLNANKRQFRFTIWMSGTARVFVQSAIAPVAAMSMRDARWTGNYRQTFAVAAIFLLPLPFEAFVAQLFCSCGLRANHKDGTGKGKWLSGIVGSASLILAGVQPRSVAGEDGEFMVLATRIFELGILMIALGMAAPINSARLYQQADAERSIVVLEWLKAYVGRLLGPFVAVLLYSYVGYGPVLGVLAVATAIVTLTA